MRFVLVLIVSFICSAQVLKPFTCPSSQTEINNMVIASMNNQLACDVNANCHYCEFTSDVWYVCNGTWSIRTESNGACSQQTVFDKNSCPKTLDAMNQLVNAANQKCPNTVGSCTYCAPNDPSGTNVAIWRCANASWIYGEGVDAEGLMNCPKVVIPSNIDIWGVNSAADIWHYTTAWQRVPGGLSYISANGAQVWGVNSAGAVFKYNGTGWNTIPGTLKQISVGPTGAVWGVNSNNAVFKYVGGSATWQTISGSLKQVSVGALNGQPEIWGTNSADQIYRYVGGSAVWSKIPSGLLTSVSVGIDGTVWGVNSASKAFQYVGGSAVWKNIPISGGLVQVSVADKNTIWGVDAASSIWRYLGSGWQQFPGGLKQISVALKSASLVEQAQTLHFEPATLAEAKSAPQVLAALRRRTSN